jgi:Mg-chelatase subunit ChlD
VGLAACLGLALSLCQPGGDQVAGAVPRGAWFEGGTVHVSAETSDPAVPLRVWDGDVQLAPDPGGSPAVPPTVILVVDAAGSAERLLRAVSAASSHMMREIPDLRVGVVFFGSSARIGVAPTTDADAVARAIEQCRGALAPSRESTSSGVGLALGLASYERRVSLVAITDGEDTAGPVDPGLLWTACARSGIPVHGFPIGNRAGVSYLEDLASLSHGVCEPLLTPADLDTALMQLARRIAGERSAAAVLPAASPGRHVLRVGTTDGPSEGSVVLFGPEAADGASLVAEVRRPDGDEDVTLLVAEREGEVLGLGLTGRPVALPAGLCDVSLGSAPTTRLPGILLAPGETRALDVVRLAGIAVSGPDLGRPDGTTATVLTPDGTRVLEVSCGETAFLLPGGYTVAVDAIPRWQPRDWFPVEAGEVHEVTCPGMGRLRVVVLGEDGQPLDCVLPIRDQHGDLVASLSAGHEISLLAGSYQVQVPIAKPRRIDCEVRAGETSEVRATDYGSLVVRAVGPGDRALSFRVLVRDGEDNGKLLASGATEAPLALRAGTYDVEILSVPVYPVPGVVIRAGERTEETVLRFGALFVTSPERAAAVRVRTTEAHRWVGSYALEEEVLLPAGEYLVSLDTEGAAEQSVRVEAQRVTHVRL